MQGQRGLQAPLLFVTFALASIASSVASPTLWAGSLIFGCAAVAARVRRDSMFEVTPTFLALFGLAAWIAFSNALISAAYSPAAPYHAAFLLLGYFLGGSQALRPGIVLCGLLSLLGIAQIALLDVPRASAVFETPATLAATLNLALLPAICIRLLVDSKPSRWSWVAVVLLSAGLASTGSRGGWIGFLAGVLGLWCAARWANLQIERRNVVDCAFLVLIGFGVALASSLAASALGTLQIRVAEMGGAANLPAIAAAKHLVSAGSIDSRLDLYMLAIAALGSTLPLGSGFLSFTYLLEAGRAAVPAYGESNLTFFVHSDYLQFLLELGVPGLVLLLACIALPIWRARSILLAKVSSGPPNTAVIGAVAALSATATHALFDFPFYVPICLLAFGIAAGAIDANAPSRGVRFHLTWRARRLARLGSAALFASIAWYLLTPVAAEFAAAYAQRQWARGHGQVAAYWLQVATRLQPRDWRYHWYSGQFWYVQAAENGNPVAARLADRSFARGMEANALEVRNVLGRIETRVRFSGLFEDGLPDEQVRHWMARAQELAPLKPAVKATAARVSDFLAASGKRRAGG